MDNNKVTSFLALARRFFEAYPTCFTGYYVDGEPVGKQLTEAALGLATMAAAADNTQAQAAAPATYDAVYQVWVGGHWRDMPKSTFDLYAEKDRRILYAHPAAAVEPVAIPAGWISVQERLPEDRTRVLGARAGLGYVTEVFHGGQSSIAGSTQKTWRLNDCSFREPVIEGITHWMPLPAAPSASSASPVVASNQGEQA